MKVSGKVGTPAQQTEAGKVKKSSVGSSGISGSPKKSLATEAFGGSARVDVSQRAQDIKKAKELATPKDSDVDEAKVARLQAMIDQGKYKVDADKIADKLVDEFAATNE
jgi:flagellar biosynthesis anti-sigma factor FlgM